MVCRSPKKEAAKLVTPVIGERRACRIKNKKKRIHLKIGFSITGFHLVHVFEEIKSYRTLPDQIIVDNGHEITSKIFLRWASENNVDIDFVEKGKTTQNASDLLLYESFNVKVKRIPSAFISF